MKYAPSSFEITTIAIANESYTIKTAFAYCQGLRELSRFTI